MRIAIIGARGVPTQYGGFDAVATELTPRLVARGCDVTVYCQPRYSLPDRPRMWNGVRLVYLPAIPKRALETVSHEAISMLHSLFCRYDVIYVLGMRATILYTVTAKSRAALFFNTDGHDYRRRKWGPRARRYLEWSEQLGVKLRPDGLISDSAAIARYFSDRYGVEATFIPYGAPELPAPDPEPVMRRGLTPGNYLLAMCRMEPENNVDKQLAAYAGVDTQMPFVIVGDTNYQSAHSNLIKSSATAGVQLTGWVFEPVELNSLLQHAYAYIHGHEVGGTNPSLLHAMAAGRCVLANDVVYNREVLGETGLYWDSSEALTKQIYAVLGDPGLTATLGNAALARVREHYDWEAVADQCVTLFEGQSKRSSSH